MISNIWRIKHDGEWKLFSALGLSRLRRTLSNQTEDIVEFFRPGAAFDEDELWAHGTTVEITRDSAQWFVGRVVQTPRDGSPGHESVGYRLAGPWHWLDNLPFQQTWNFADENGDPQEGQTTHLFLGQTAEGEPMTTGQQIQEIIAWAVGCGAPLQAGTGYPELTVPIREIRELSCGEAIRQMLRWHPDAAAWFDYSTTPPTLNIKRRADLVELVMTVGQKPLKAFSVTPRRDQQVSAVVLKFEQTNTVDGVINFVRKDQVYPPGATGKELGALVASVDLMGFQATYTRATITTQAIVTSGDGSLDWWKSKLPWLKDAKVTSFSASGVVSDPPTAYTRELIEGQITPWMDVEADRVQIRAQLRVNYTDADGNPHIKNDVQSVYVVATNAPLGEKTYISLQSFTSGEDEPLGLAQGLYEAMSPVQYEGQVTLHESEAGTKLAALGISGRYGVGCRLNLTGGLAEWSTMNALVQQVTEDIDTGTTTLSFGPAGHLGPGELIELLRLTRLRLNYTALSARTDPQSTTRGQVELGRKTPNDSASAGAPAWEKLWVAKQSAKIRQEAAESTATLELTEATSGTRSAKLEATATAARSVLSDGSKTCERNTSHLPSWVRANDMKYRECRICLTIGGTPTQMKICGELSLAYDEATGKYYDPATATEVTS